MLIVAVYISPSANVINTLAELNKAISKVQNSHTDFLLTPGILTVQTSSQFSLNSISIPSGLCEHAGLCLHKHRLCVLRQALPYLVHSDHISILIRDANPILKQTNTRSYLCSSRLFWVSPAYGGSTNLEEYMVSVTCYFSHCHVSLPTLSPYAPTRSRHWLWRYVCCWEPVTLPSGQTTKLQDIPPRCAEWHLRLGHNSE